MKPIRISQSSNADTRSAREKVSMDTLLTESQHHIHDVAQALNWMSDKLFEVAKSHDWTKLTYNDEFYADFSATQDGFQGDFKQMHWYHDIHLQERHHLNDYCPEDVNLFDVLERIADGVTAGLARRGSVYEDILNPEILQRAYQNTMKLLIENTEVID